MSETVIAALIALVAALGGAAQVRTSRKLTRLSRENHALWYYTRHLIDWGYRPHGPGDRPPDPPESIKHLYEFGEHE